MAVLFVVAVALGIWLWLGLSTPEPGGGEHEAPAQTEGTEPGFIEGIGVIPGVREAPLLEPTTGGDTLDLGTVAYGENRKRLATRLRLASGRPDPIAMTNMRIVVAPGAQVATLPTLQPGTEQCMSGNYEQRDDGTYCEITLLWTPEPGETLDAHLLAKVAVWEKRELVLAAEHIADKPGGWNPYTLELKIVGTADIAPAPATLEVDTQRIEWDAAAGEREENEITITARNRPIDVHAINIAPPIDDAAITVGRIGECTGEREPEVPCPFYVRWAPQQPPLGLSAEISDHEIVIAWREINRLGERGQLRETNVALVRTLHPPGRTEAKIAADPEIIEWEKFTIGRRTEVVELTITVSAAPITVERIHTTPEAEKHKISITGSGKCTRVYQPRRQTNIDWCRMQITAVPASETMEGAALLVEWSHGQGTDALRDRFELTIPLRGTGRKIDARAPAELTSDPPGPIDLGQAQSATTKIERITLTNRGGSASRATIESIAVVATDVALREGLGVNAQDCTRRALRGNDFCDIELSWTPRTGRAIAATIEIKWNSGQTRERTLIEITGQGPGAETGPAIASPAAVARAAFRARRARNAGGQGWHVDVAAHRALVSPPTGPPRLIDYDQSEVSQPWIKSTRPIPMHTVVLPNTPLAAVLLHEINAVYTSPVVAIIERDIWSSGPQRTKIIPRGARLEGTIAGLRSGEGSGSQINGTEVRVMVSWRTLTRHDGATFGLAGGAGGGEHGSVLATTDLMSRAGLPAVVDPYELENWIGIMGGAAIEALLIMAGPEITYGTVTETTPGGGTVERAQRQPTRKELAWLQLQSGVSEIGNIMKAFTRPLPSIVVPAGTRMRLYPSQGLVLRPIEYEPPAQMAARQPTDPTGPAGTAQNGATPGGATTHQSPPPVNAGDGQRTAADDGGAPGAVPYWAQNARERGHGLRIDQEGGAPTGTPRPRQTLPELPPLPEPAQPGPTTPGGNNDWMDLMTTPPAS